MALKLQKELDTGVLAEYWSISELKVRNGKLDIRLDLHISQQVKSNGKTPIETRRIVLECPKSDVINNNVYELAYNMIKASKLVDGQETNEFANAVDC